MWESILWSWINATINQYGRVQKFLTDCKIDHESSVVIVRTARACELLFVHCYRYITPVELSNKLWISELIHFQVLYVGPWTNLSAQDLQPSFTTHNISSDPQVHVETQFCIQLFHVKIWVDHFPQQICVLRSYPHCALSPCEYFNQLWLCLSVPMYS